MAFFKARSQMLLCVSCKAVLASPVEVRAGQLSLRPEALEAAQEVTNGLKHFEKSLPLGRQRAVRAATRVNAERAPKKSTWEPTRHNNGEGRCRLGRERQAPGGPTGVVGGSTHGKGRYGTGEVCSGAASSGAAVATALPRGTGSARVDGGWVHSTEEAGEHPWREGALVLDERTTQ